MRTQILCIYEIVNIKNNKRYIGSAKDFQRRKRTHLNLLKKQKHHSSKLQNSYNKYGEYHFHFYIIEEVQDLKDLIVREQFYLDLIKPELNMTLTAGLNSSQGLKRSKTTCEKISKALTGKKLSDETKKLLRDANLGKKASEETKKKMSGSIKNSEKFKSSRSKDLFKRIQETKIKNGTNKPSQGSIEKIRKTLIDMNQSPAISKKVGKYNLDGTLVEIFPSINKAAINLKMTRMSLANILFNKNKKSNKIGGFIWNLI